MSVVIGCYHLQADLLVHSKCMGKTCSLFCFH